MRPILFDKEPAYILHRRPHQERTELIDFLTLNYGRRTAIARQSAALAGKPLQAFTPMLITCSQGNTLLNLRQVELNGKLHLSDPVHLIFGMYLNELLLRLVPSHFQSTRLFVLYNEILDKLAQEKASVQETRAYCESLLRNFEVQLLKRIGYGLQLQYEANSQTPLDPSALYRYEIEEGPVLCSASEQGAESVCHGQTLLALEENFVSEQVYNKAEMLQEAKNLLRAVLGHYLQGKAVNTRTIFQFLNEQ